MAASQPIECLLLNLRLIMSATGASSVESSSVADGSTGVARRGQIDDESSWLMVGISAGHGIKHFGQGALLVMMPFIRATYGIGDVAYGTIFSLSSISSVWDRGSG